MSIQRDKILQSKEIIYQGNIDVWITIGRETTMNSDPVIPLISKNDFGSMTAVIIGKGQESLCLTGHLDYEGMVQSEVYDQVLQYNLDFDEAFVTCLEKIKPQKIALNFSEDVSCDGLTHGLFLKLQKLFTDKFPRAEIVSAEDIIKKLRSRKTDSEVAAIKKAIALTEKILLEAKDFIQPGVTEQEIYAFCQSRLVDYKGENAWDKKHNPGVMVGKDTPFGHAGATDLKVQPGDLVTLDFGAKIDAYCADLQRVYYVPNPGEDMPPKAYISAFEGIQSAVDQGVKAMAVGQKGYQPDQAARGAVKALGLPDFNFAFGHQVGREAHDGGVLMGPLWPRYKGLVEGPLEASSVYTVDVNIPLETGHMGQEDMVYLTEEGVSFLSKRQEKIYMCRGGQ